MVIAHDSVRFGPAVRDVLSVARAGDPLRWSVWFWLRAARVVRQVPADVRSPQAA